MLAIKTKTTVNTFMRRMDSLNRAVPMVRDESLRRMSRAALAFIIERAPKDTNRYVRAVAEAGNRATVGPFTLKTLRESNYRARYLELLADQIDRWEMKANRVRQRIDFLYPNGAPAKNGQLYNKLIRERDKTDQRLLRAKEEMQKALGSDTAIFIGHIHSGQAQKGRKLLTVRTPVYGGEGHFISRAYGCSVVIKVLEPHANFVERRQKLFATARKVLFTQGVAEFKTAQSLLATRATLTVSGAMGGKR